MMKICLVPVLLILMCSAGTNEEKVHTAEIIFVSRSVTYNGSDNPNECYESVDQGISIKKENHSLFLLLPASEFENLQERFEGEMVRITYVLFDHPVQGSGASGSILKIWYNDQVVFESE